MQISGLFGGWKNRVNIYKLLVNDKCMIVEVPIAYIVTLAMCHL